MGVLIGAALFGSVARGDDDALSDLDVLALVENGAGMVADGEVLATLPPHLVDRAASISWYGADRFTEMHRAGELFAWHVFLDAKVLYDPSRQLERLGRPAPYVGAVSDVDAFIAIAADLPFQLSSAACNAIYEMGVLYVCLRNVAMSASALLAPRPDFTRMAPYQLEQTTVRLAVPEEEYRISMLCRLAGQRGLTIPADVTADRVLSYHQQAFDWMLSVRASLEQDQGNV